MIDSIDLKKEIERIIPIVEQMPKETQDKLKRMLYYYVFLRWLNDTEMQKK